MNADVKSPDWQPSPRAVELFRDFQERWYSSEDVDLEQVCRQHPELEADLRRLEVDWRQTLDLLDKLPLPGSLGDRLQRTYGTNPDPAIALDPRSPDSMPSSQLLRRLAIQPPAETRYVLQGEIAQGGMGTILRVWDEEFRRNLAMKVANAQLASTDSSKEPANLSKLARFLEEAQITGQLDHPGIVPVHELGLDQEGKLYFTMRLVKGRTLKEIFDLTHEGKEGWTLTRTLNVMLRVCETMAYAHSKKVIHRDLKPANIMVGRYGETYVMDWGLARVLDREDNHDIRLRDDDQTATRTVIHTELDQARREDPDSPLMTMDGDVIGTPSYMAPEQASGQVNRVGPRSDVYSVGAMLYHLLSGQLPYWPPGTRLSQRTILGLVVQGPPSPIHQLQAKVPAELIAICEKAMSRDPKDRYADMSEMADELRSYLEHRVVHAYETGALAELRKWVTRNKGVAVASLAAIVLALGGLGGIAIVRSIKEAEVMRLADVKIYDDLVKEANVLWPERPERTIEMESWLEHANGLLTHLPQHETTLASWRKNGKHEKAPDGTESWQFASIQERWRHEMLAKLVRDLRRWKEPTGLIADVAVRLQEAMSVEDRTIVDLREAWDETRAAIANEKEIYGGLDLKPQVGLVPLGRDPESGLFEFAVPRTGEIPKRDPSNGKLELTSAGSMVLVLIPGGTFLMGAQSNSKTAPNYDPLARGDDEAPVVSVNLDPFFLSKYEFTQAQWKRVMHTEPSENVRSKKGMPDPMLRPVEAVSWNQCTELVLHLGLTLPTEAQWEYAARAKTHTPWWTGDHKESLSEAANVADQALARDDPHNIGIEEWNDGYSLHSPVARFLPNAFGLYDVLGNVFEWCSGAFCEYTVTPRPGDGERSCPDEKLRVARGGAFNESAANCRVTTRCPTADDNRNYAFGVRPARKIDP